uniref:LysE family translocator n=1 Tax=Photorhabdus luminescens TaxID=29488 RepID=Q93EQ4_PHOLU|nr:unknown [Photorhabdus luminescens]
MELSLFAAFWVVSVLLIITPGADWAYAISAGMHGRVVLPAVTGLLCGHLIATIVVAAGVGALVAGTPVALTVLTVAGAGYLLWLGINMIRHPSAPTTSDEREVGSRSQWAIKGLCVSGLNPKVSLLFLGTVAAVHRSDSRLADPGTNYGIGPASHFKLWCNLSDSRIRFPGNPKNPPTGRAYCQPGIRRCNDYHRGTLIGRTIHLRM